MMEEEQKEPSMSPSMNPIMRQDTAQEIESVFDDKERDSAQKVEAALFIAGRFLDLQELVMLTDVNPVLLRSILHDLEKKYTHGVIRLLCRNNAWKMDVEEKYHYLIN